MIGNIKLVNIQPEHFAGLEALQRIVFPTLTDDEIFTAEKYAKHIEVFPDGQFCAVAKVQNANKVVGATSTYRTNFDFDHIQHSFMEACADGWLTNHDPNGEWLYGVDLMVHPNFWRRGIGSALYKARHNLAERLNLRGEIAGGMLPGYEKHRKKMSIEVYAKRVANGELRDPTMSMQRKNGFKFRGVLYDHITDPRSDNCAALIVRENPKYKATRG